MTRAARTAFDEEWKAAGLARQAGDFAQAMHHLERAHILGQRHTRLHVRSHVGMWLLARERRDWREALGQIPRIVAAALFSRVWVPHGNTGGANVSAFRPMPAPVL
ncbi:MAG TPA: DUF3703 domain-containing protein, partial [Tahibacter sp.]|nr:DUF3703 domain-containing protein [Tahibacter sp.]